MEWRGIFFTGLIFLFFKFTPLQAGDGREDQKKVIQESQQESQLSFEIWRTIFQYIHPLEWTRMSQVNRLFYNATLSLCMAENELECICLEKNSLRFEYLQWQALKKVFILLFDYFCKQSMSINVKQLEKTKLAMGQFVFQENSFAFFVQKSVIDYLENPQNSKNRVEDWIKEKDLSIAQKNILSICYRYGIGVQKSKDQAIEYEKKVIEEYQRRQIGKLPFFFMDRIRFFLEKRLEKLKKGDLELKKLSKFMQICARSKSVNFIQFVKEWANLESNWIKNIINCSEIELGEKLKFVSTCLEIGVNSSTVEIWLNEECQKTFKMHFEAVKYLEVQTSIFVRMKYIQFYIQLKKNLKFQHNKDLDLKMGIVCSELNSDQFLKNFSDVFSEFKTFFGIFNPELKKDLSRLQLAQLYMELKKDLETYFDSTLLKKFFEMNLIIQRWLNFKQEQVIMEILSGFDQEVLDYLERNFGRQGDLEHIIFRITFRCCSQSKIKELENKAEKWLKSLLSRKVIFTTKLELAYQYWKIFGNRELILKIWSIQNQKELELLIKNNGFFPDNSHSNSSQIASHQYRLIHFCSFLGNAEEKIIEQLKVLDESSRIYENSKNRVNHFLVELDTIIYFLSQDVLPEQLRQYGGKWLLSEQTYLNLREVFEGEKIPDIEQLALLYSRVL